MHSFHGVARACLVASRRRVVNPPFDEGWKDPRRGCLPAGVVTLPRGGFWGGPRRGGRQGRGNVNPEERERPNKGERRFRHPSTTCSYVQELASEKRTRLRGLAGPRSIGDRSGFKRPRERERHFSPNRGNNGEFRTPLELSILSSFTHEGNFQPSFSPREYFGSNKLAGPRMDAHLFYLPRGSGNVKVPL